jgi:pimeloyl-ACP methyl ester carboxylesterase
MIRAQTAVLAVTAAVTAAIAGCSGTSPTSGAAAGSSTSAAPSGAVPSGSGPLSAPGTASRLTWRSCPSVAAGAPDARQMRCTSLQVPVNYADPGGRKITLALSEIPATAPAAEQQGVLLVNPGGPGAPGRSMAATTAVGLPANVAAKYTVVGFDTRGVGASVPALSCDPSFFSRPRPGYVPANAAAEQVLIDRARAYAAGCEQRFGWLLPYMTTQDLARDMDSIRAALGQQQISYYGVSYGTYLGQVYASMFPQRIRRMVLDSVVDPAGAWYADNIAQDYAFQGRLTAFFAWIAANNAVYHLGASEAAVNATFSSTLASLARQPIAGASGPVIGPDELSDTFLIGGYSNAWWPYLAGALAAYLHGGSSSQLMTIYREVGQQNENEFAVYTAVECSDVAWPRSWARWDADTRRVFRTAPFEAWGNAWFNAACAFWPVHGPATPPHVGASGLPPILMLQGSLDAATPYQGALVARRLLPTARMVVVTGGGNHGQSLAFPPNSCVNGYLDRYLATGALPEKPGLVNATCPALPSPSA